MEGLRRSIERGAVVTTNGTSGWQKPAIAGLWALVILFAGWMWSMNEASQKAAAAKTDAAVETVHLSQERIATLEEAVRGLTRSLDRIEAGVDELRRGEPKREPRR